MVFTLDLEALQSSIIIGLNERAKAEVIKRHNDDVAKKKRDAVLAEIHDRLNKGRNAGKEDNTHERNRSNL